MALDLHIIDYLYEFLISLILLIISQFFNSSLSLYEYNLFEPIKFDDLFSLKLSKKEDRPAPGGIIFL